MPCRCGSARREDHDLLPVARRGLVHDGAGEGRDVGRVHVGGRRLNSAAQVSMRLKTGRTDSARRFARTSSSSSPASTARRASEKPAALSCRKAPAVVAARGPSPGAPDPRWPEAAPGTTGRSCTRHGLPRGSHRSAGPGDLQEPVRRGRAERGLDGIAVVALPSPSISISSRPVRPVSSERSAFCRDSAKQRPMAIASPTDFIAVVSVGSAPGIFRRRTRDLGHDIVDRRLERGRRRAAGDVVGDLVSV